jgi:hypothetical protein
LKDGHYEWYYWDPAGEWDIKPLKPNEWKHWMGPEHRGGYYSLSLSQAVSLYQYGLVFDKTDIDRFVKTQLKMCWNGDFAHPVWSRVDGTRPAKYTQGEYIGAALAPFSESVAQFVYGGQRQEWLAGHVADAWQATQTGGWLRGKLLDYPAAKDGAQPYSTYGQRFLAKKENRDFLASLAFEVTAPGYQPPHTPAEMKNMPKEPQGVRRLSAD